MDLSKCLLKHIFTVFICRGMLSSAHVLAMDAKNLLDVVDGIRMKYPNVNSHIIRLENDLECHHLSSGLEQN